MLRIIIADDEFDIVELCRALITYPGAEIVGEACNGIELLKKIEELHPDVVITDICMPGMTGLELIERAKQEFPAINFIVMSGYTVPIRADSTAFRRMGLPAQAAQKSRTEPSTRKTGS